MNFKNREEKLVCPYNESHVIMRYRFEDHLEKCRKSYTGKMVLVECDFNNSHRVLELEIDYHHSICPDRKNVELVVYNEESKDKEQNVAPFNIKNLPVQSESWETEGSISGSTYKPQEAAEKKNILISLSGESRSKKREFRLQRRRHLLENQKDQSLQSIQASLNRVFHEPLPETPPVLFGYPLTSLAGLSSLHVPLSTVVQSTIILE